MSNQTNQPPFCIVNGHVSDVAPVHHAGREINQIIGLHGEKVCRHELTHSTIAVFPFFRLVFVDCGPTMNRFTLLLVCQHRGGQSSPAGLFCSGGAFSGKRLHYPARTRLSAAGPFFDDAEILVNVFSCELRTAKAVTRKWKQFVENERSRAETLSVKPLELS